VWQQLLPSIGQLNSFLEIVKSQLKATNIGFVNQQFPVKPGVDNCRNIVFQTGD